MSEPKNFTGYFRNGQAIIAPCFGLPGFGCKVAHKQKPDWHLLLAGNKFFIQVSVRNLYFCCP
jgi:hypothetical protein